MFTSSYISQSLLLALSEDLGLLERLSGFSRDVVSRIAVVVPECRRSAPTPGSHSPRSSKMIVKDDLLAASSQEA